MNFKHPETHNGISSAHLKSPENFQGLIDGELFSCTRCEKRFFVESDPLKHLALQSIEKPFSCDTCYKTFSCRSELNNHSDSLCSETRLINETRGDKYKSKTDPSFLNIENFSCDNCGKVFSSVSDLNEHLKIDISELPFACDTCDERFDCKLSVTTHCLDHIRKTVVLSCGKCGKTFNSQPSLTEHFKSHADDTSFVFKMCGQVFNSNTNLMVHRFANDCEKAVFKCKKCMKVFVHQYDLDKHLKIHNDEMTAGCDAC